MSFETEQANLVTISNAIPAIVGPAFVNSSIAPLVTRRIPFGASKMLTLPIAGSLTAATVAESTAITWSADHEYAETSVTCTAKKTVGGFKRTVEAIRFNEGRVGLEQLLDEAGRAIARSIDADLKTLFSSLAQIITATTTLTKDNLLDAIYTIQSAMGNAWSGQLVGMFDYKGISELRKVLTDTTASALGKDEFLGVVLNAANPANGYVGKLFGIELFQTSGLPSGGGDDTAAVWDPQNCFVMGYDEQGIQNNLVGPNFANGLAEEASSHFFNKIVEWRDAAGCAVKSDT